MHRSPRLCSASRAAVRVPSHFRRSVSSTTPILTTKKPDPLQQLHRVADLQRRTAAENSKNAKAGIIAEYPDLRPLLEFIHQPDLRLRVSSASLQKYMNNSPSDRKDGSISPPPDSLLELYERLSDPKVSGHAAKDMIIAFLETTGIRSADGEDSIALNTFYRLLDRSLKAGWSATTLQNVPWIESRQSVSEGTAGDERASAPTAGDKHTTKTSPSLAKFSVPLGKTIEAPFLALWKGQDGAKWYASRKLDGVRCITFIDIVDGQPPVVENIKFLSRHGNEFTSLANLREQLEHIAYFPQLREWLDRGESEVSPNLKRIVLDGEVCVMRPSQTFQPRNDGTAASSLWAHDGLEEDFTATVSQIKRKNEDVDLPAYFLLDVIPWMDFCGQSTGRSFIERHKDTRALGDYFTKLELQYPLLRAVTQTLVETEADAEEMVHRATDEGWEGLVFRADRPYKGKRSTDIYKFKKWQDGEYTVTSLDTSIQRLAVNGTYSEHEACSNVWIEHNGHPVSVGTGFTTEQRLRYARNPSLIVGKQITVEYFGESEASGRDKGVMSLRFPRIKTVWEEGKRRV